MKRKSLLILMALMICLSSFAGFTVSAFSDVAEGDKHAYAINHLTEKGVISGYPDGTYKPQNNITRAEFLTLLLESINITNFYGELAVKTGFADVDLGTHNVNDFGNQYTITNQAQHWAAGYIKIAVDKKIVSGYGNGLFKPDNPVTYEEAIKMIVCALGREGMAQTKVDKMGIPFWPDAYLSVGNDLVISRDTDYAPNTPATRGNIAQMLYNVKDVTPIFAPNVSGGGSGGSGGGGGGGGYGGGYGGGGSYSEGESSEDEGSSTVPITNLYVDGQVVALVKNPHGDNRIPLIIDNNLEIDGKKVTELERNYLYLKLDEPEEDDEGNIIRYKKFYTHKEDYSYYLGHSVTLKYTYNPDGTVGGRDEIDGFEMNDSVRTYVESTQIKSAKVDDVENNTTITYFDGENNQKLHLYTTDYDSIKVIFNDKVVDVAALREQYKLDHPDDVTPIEEIDIITLDDVVVKDGAITVIDAYDDEEIDLIWIDSYETYVVGSVNKSTKVIKDKFRKNPDGSAVSLDFSKGTVIVKSGSEDKEFKNISTNNILKIARTKCGTKTTINYEKIASVTSNKVSVKQTDGVKKALVVNASNEYPVTDYFRDYVDDESLYFEYGDSVKLFYNTAKQIYWIELAQPSYQTGYLISGKLMEEDDKLSLKILIPASYGDGKTIDVVATKELTRYITEADECLKVEGAPKPVTNLNGNMYKGLDVDLMFESLKENAAKINAGKAEKLVESAIVAQPVMFESKGLELNYLVTISPDEKNTYKGTPRTLTKSGSSYRFTRETTPEQDLEEGFTGNTTFEAESGAIFIFVPNNRTYSGYSKGAGYKIGTVSASKISEKLVEYMPYNIEPFFVRNATSGNLQHKIFVVYNEDIDARPTYRSENMIITELSREGDAHKIKGYTSMSKTVEYTYYTESVGKKATVLDENFNRTDKKAEIAVGDVIRVGKSPADMVVDIEIIFDISEAKTERKSTAVDYRGDPMTTHEPEERTVQYFARIGEITHVDTAETPKYLNFTTNSKVNAEFYIGSTFNSTQIFLYDFTSLKENIVPEKMTIEKAELLGGEVLFIKQGEKLANELIYAVRLED